MTSLSVKVRASSSSARRFIWDRAAKSCSCFIMCCPKACRLYVLMDKGGAHQERKNDKLVIYLYHISLAKPAEDMALANALHVDLGSKCNQQAAMTKQNLECATCFQCMLSMHAFSYMKMQLSASKQ